MKTGRKLRCAIYTRKSTEEGLDHDFNSLEAQREACAAYVLSQTHEGWEALPTRYDDGGFSGGNMDRPALKALMAEIEKGQVDIIVVYKVDRLTRSLADFAKLVESFDRHNVSFVSVTQAFNTTNSMGRLTLNVLLSFAQFEREVTAERIRDKFRASKEKGMWMGGRPPLGYDVENRKLVINAKEADRVRFIFNRYLELKSAMLLQADLKRQGITGKHWTTQKGKEIGGGFIAKGALYCLLQNPIYIGRIRHHDKVHDGQHEPIVDNEIWSKVQKLIGQNRSDNRTKTNTKAPSLLADLLFLVDGSPFRPRHSTKTRINHRYYVHPKQTLPAHEIESLVTNELTALLRKPAELSDILALADPDDIQIATEEAQIYADLLEAGPRRDIVCDMIRRIVVDDASITIEIDIAALRQLLLPQAQFNGGTPSESDGTYRVSRNFQLKRCGNGKRLIIGQDDSTNAPKADPSMLKTLGRAHAWFDDLKKGESYAEIAKWNEIDERVVARTIRLAFLAPDIVAQILQGNEPNGLTAHRLMRMPKLPADWNEQRTLLGFS